MVEPFMGLWLAAFPFAVVLGQQTTGQSDPSIHAQTPQLTPTNPQLEQRDQPVTAEDLTILVRAEALLSDDSVWSRNDDRECQDDEATGKRSLFCALRQACIEVLGTYDHRRVALQEVRFAVDDATRDRNLEHRLRDFNNLPETRLADIKRVLEVAKTRVNARLKTTPGPPSVAGVAQPADLPRFDRVVLLETTAETSANVSIGDVNGDGHLDIVLAKGRHWGLVDRVLFGDGRGGFPSGHDLGPASDRTYSGNLVDLDGDSDLDVVISNDTPDPKRIYLNDGTGHFRAKGTYGRATWSTRNAAVADIDGDRRPDIIVANRTPPSNGGNYVCLNRGKGRFDAHCTMFAREPSTTITAADFNRDGRIDLVVPHRDGGQSHLYLNKSTTGTVRFDAVPFGPPDATIRMSAAADLDSDGIIDIVAIDEKLGLFAFFGNRVGVFSAAVPIGARGRTPYALATADLNQDGAVDIVVGNVEAPATVFFNDGSGKTHTPVDFGDDKGTVYGFAIADLDMDGRLDIAMARSEAPNVVYFGGPGPTTQR